MITGEMVERKMPPSSLWNDIDNLKNIAKEAIFLSDAICS
jgi:hypothetical protein